MSLERIVFEPIGYVHTNAVGDAVKDKQVISEISINPKFADGLDGVTGFSHIFVLFYLSEVTAEQRMMLKVHPRGRSNLPLTGVFAVRTMMRPNPIALTLVELIKVEGNVITVRGLDAFDGTPVLDIKPYDPWDRVEGAMVPEWWRQLEKEGSHT